MDWTNEHSVALRGVLDDIVNGGLLMPRFGETFILTTDFSYDGLGAVLSQEVDGVEKPIMFASRVLAPAELKYSPTEGEALGVLFGLKRFAHVLYGQRVIIRTDHRPLVFVK